MRQTQKNDFRKTILMLVVIAALFFLLWFLAGCGKPQENAAREDAVSTTMQMSANIADSFGVSSEELSDMAVMQTEMQSDNTEASAQPGSENEENKLPYQIPNIHDTVYNSDIINNGVPIFSEDDIAKISSEKLILSELDEYGRCGSAFMIASPSTLTHEERGAIGHVKPSGWHTVKYPEVIKDLYLYNRCHILAYSISGILDDNRNLITGTRQMNLEMLEYEKSVLRYIENTGNSVYYRVTPLFTNDNLVADGVLMEAESVEDSGDGLQFCCVCWNKQNGVTIDYHSGDSALSADVSSDTVDTIQSVNNGENTSGETAQNSSEEVQNFILNTNSGKIHIPTCESVSDMNPNNKKEVTDTLSSLKAQGYSPCGRCLG